MVGSVVSSIRVLLPWQQCVDAESVWLRSLGGGLWVMVCVRRWDLFLSFYLSLFPFFSRRIYDPAGRGGWEEVGLFELGLGLGLVLRAWGYEACHGMV